MQGGRHERIGGGPPERQDLLAADPSHLGARQGRGAAVRRSGSKEGMEGQARGLGACRGRGRLELPDALPEARRWGGHPKLLRELPAGGVEGSLPRLQLAPRNLPEAGQHMGIVAPPSHQDSALGAVALP